MSLYIINKKMLEILDWEFDEEQIEEVQNQFLKLEWDKNEKIDNTIKYIRNVEWDFENLDTEIKRLQELKKIKQLKIEKLNFFGRFFKIL